MRVVVIVDLNHCNRCFIRTGNQPLTDYGDVIYDQPQHESFCEKLGLVQYKASLVTTGAIMVICGIRFITN